MGEGGNEAYKIGKAVLPPRMSRLWTMINQYAF
jgi:hypothetical protein